MPSLPIPTIRPPCPRHPLSPNLSFFNHSLPTVHTLLHPHPPPPPQRRRHSPPPAAAIPSTSHRPPPLHRLSERGPLEAILFDIDGTLCDSDPLHFYAFRELLQQVGFNNGVPITEEFFIKNISGRHNEDLCGTLFPDWDLQKAKTFLEDKETYFCRLASEKLKGIEGLEKVCKWIKERGVKRAAVTNTPRQNAELILSILGLSDFFQAVVIGAECERAKPFPDPYLNALNVLGVSYHHTFVFEDSYPGVKAGVGAGIGVVGVGRRNPEELLKQAGASFVIKDFNDPQLWSLLKDLDTAFHPSNSIST